MDENNEKIPQEKPAHAASNGGSAQNRERRSRNNGRRPGKRPPNNRKNDRQPRDAAEGAEAAQAKRPQTDARPQKTAQPKSPDGQKKRPEAVKGTPKNDKRDRGGKRRPQQQNEPPERRGASAVPTDAAERPRRTAGDVQPATDTLDRFADISLSGSGRLGLASSSVIADESDDAPLPPDAFRIPDSEILPECLLPHESAPAEVQTPTQDLTEVVGVRFENSGKTYYFAPGADKFKRGEHAIVETSRGVEYGEISMGNTFVPNSEIVQPLRAVGRRANENDAKRNEENHRREAEAMKVCAEKIAAHGLDMKLVGSSYTFDNSKLIFYFTAAGRVDFRELVKDLAAVFRTRIELWKIGIRDEAKMIGGCGVCGRKLCCASFLPNFAQVSIRMAKEQGLSLSSSKISGCCGRLMCCLRFEHETYEREIRLTPPVDSIVKTVDGRGTVTENSPIAGTVKVRLDEKPGDPPRVYKRDDVKIISRGSRRNDDVGNGDDDRDVVTDE